jgi:hypothetical protein
VRLIKQPTVTEAHERINVKRATAEEASDDASRAESPGAEGEMNDTDARLWHPVAPHQSRPARDAAHALECGGVVRGPRRVQEGARDEESDPARGSDH